MFQIGGNLLQGLHGSLFEGPYCRSIEKRCNNDTLKAFISGGMLAVKDGTIRKRQEFRSFPW